jgi:hypothetical protein
LTNSLANNFCSQCGNALVQTAVICPKCGSPTARFNQVNSHMPGNNYYPGSAVVPQKTKSTSVILAVFLGFWTYLYTFQKDAALFWVSLGIQGFFIFAISSAPGLETSGALLFIVFIFWLLSVIVTASRSSQWYIRYPNN